MGTVTEAMRYVLEALIAITMEIGIRHISLQEFSPL